MLLAMLGVCEAVAHTRRLAVAVRSSAMMAAVAAGCICVLRMVFVWMGVSAFLADGAWWFSVAAYVIPAAVATGVVHAMEAKA